jgi:hypothetical protein
MPIVLQSAVKILKPIKVMSYGPTYSGKTLSSLYLAVGAVMNIRKCTEAEAYKHIVLIDTEFGRGALYNKIGLYNYLKIDPPYFTEKLVTMLAELNTMEQVDVIIIDSITHFWVKEGGILDQKAMKDKLGGNSYTNWQDFTTKFNKMIDSILSSPKHIFVTARAKTDTALITGENGKATPKSYGLKPELRDNVEYDFDIVFNIDKISHNLIVDKGIPGLKPVYEMATPKTGQEIFDLFTADATLPTRSKVEIANSLRQIAKTNDMIPFVQLELRGRKLEDLNEDELKSIEAILLNNIKKMQVKN